MIDLISKTGILWAILGLFTLFCAAVTWVEIMGLRGWTFSQRFLELSRSHPGWLLPLWWAFVCFIGLLCGHLTQTPRLYRDWASILYLIAQIVIFAAFAVAGSWIWPQPAP